MASERATARERGKKGFDFFSLFLLSFPEGFDLFALFSLLQNQSGKPDSFNHGNDMFELAAL
jgi:hypothetical protein